MQWGSELSFTTFSMSCLLPAWYHPLCVAAHDGNCNHIGKGRVMKPHSDQETAANRMSAYCCKRLTWLDAAWVALLPSAGTLSMQLFRANGHRIALLWTTIRAQERTATGTPAPGREAKMRKEDIACTFFCLYRSHISQGQPTAFCTRAMALYGACMQALPVGASRPGPTRRVP